MVYKSLLKRGGCTYLLFMTAILAGCNSASQETASDSSANSDTTATKTTATTPNTATAQGKGKWVIGFSQCNVAEPWRTAMDNALMAEFARHKDEIKTVLLKDAQNSNPTQVGDVEDLLNSGINLLIISPNEAVPLTQVVQKVYKQGIPVVILDRAIVGDTYTCFIGADNTVIGKKAGDFVAKELQGKGDVVEIKGKIGSPPAGERHDGFMAGIKGSPGIHIIQTAVGDWLKDKAHDQMREILAAQPHIDLVYAHNDDMAMGAYLAAQEQKREKEMKFVGIDGLPGPNGGPAQVKAGKLAATFLYPNCGKEAIDYSLQILEGKKVPKRVILPTATITADNADQFINPS